MIKSSGWTSETISKFRLFGTAAPVPAESLSDSAPDLKPRAFFPIRRAIIFSKPEPSYTEQARHHNTRGVVRLSAVLAADGQVKNILAIKRLPDGLTENAIAAARQIKFTPATLNGQPMFDPKGGDTVHPRNVPGGVAWSRRVSQVAAALQQQSAA